MSGTIKTKEGQAFCFPNPIPSQDYLKLNWSMFQEFEAEVNEDYHVSATHLNIKTPVSFYRGRNSTKSAHVAQVSSQQNDQQ